MPRAAEDPSFALPVQYVRHIADRVRALGAPVAEWLAEGGLTEAELLDPALVIGYRAFHALVRASIALTGEPAIGLFVGEQLLASAHGILGYGASTSSCLREALDLFERYTRLRTSLVKISYTTNADEAFVRVAETRSLGDVRVPVLEAVVMSVTKVLDSISTGACRVRYVAFPFEAPGHAPLARELFRCDVRYRRPWAGIALPASALDLRLSMADPEAFRLVTLACQRELEKLAPAESLAGRVRRLLLEGGSHFPSLLVASRLVKMSPRTFHRRLEDEGTSYRALVEETRHAMALEHVVAARLGLETIAYALGYSDLANFRRAFKRWESMSPAEYRAAHARPPSGARARPRSRGVRQTRAKPRP